MFLKLLAAFVAADAVDRAARKPPRYVELPAPQQQTGRQRGAPFKPTRPDASLVAPERPY